MYQFSKVAFKKDMLELNVDGKPTWYFCSPEVKGFASKAIKEGEEVDIVSDTRSGDKGPQNWITRITKKGSNQTFSQTTPPPVQKVVENPQGGTFTPRQSYIGKSPEDTKQIRRLSVLSSATQAIQVLAGSISDPGTLSEAVITVYNRLLQEVEKS